MAEETIVLTLPKRAVEEAHQRWPQLRQHPTLNAISPRPSPTTTVRSLLFLSNLDMTAGVLPGTGGALKAELEKARAELAQARRRIAELEGSSKAA